uniref:Uncharacterized protein n=1 Tax=Lepeophtheirus salmonis TaxID=72036 RepID=A0A0K2T040_LEPSM
MKYCRGVRITRVHFLFVFVNGLLCIS